mgnify:CR=1 FL=1
MIARMMMTLGTTMALASFVAGVAHSSYRHYYTRYADEEDRLSEGTIQEVSIVKDETKKSRGKK